MILHLDEASFDDRAADLVVTAIMASDHALKAAVDMIVCRNPQHLKDAAGKRIVELKRYVSQLENDLAQARRLAAIPDPAVGPIMLVPKKAARRAK